jgi:hypothetical protein
MLSQVLCTSLPTRYLAHAETSNEDTLKTWKPNLHFLILETEQDGKYTIVGLLHAPTPLSPHANMTPASQALAPIRQDTKVS